MLLYVPPEVSEPRFLEKLSVDWNEARLMQFTGLAFYFWLLHCRHMRVCSGWLRSFRLSSGSYLPACRQG